MLVPKYLGFRQIDYESYLLFLSSQKLHAKVPRKQKGSITNIRHVHILTHDLNSFFNGLQHYFDKGLF